MTKKTRFAIGAIVVAAGALGLWIYRNAEAHEAPAYRFATVTRGNLESTVSATGALSAVTTVQVGTQVSGQVSQTLRRLQRSREEGPAARAHRSDAAAAGRARRAGRARSARRPTSTARRPSTIATRALFDQKVLTATEFTRRSTTIRSRRRA